MLKHTTEVMNQCVGYTENLQANSWGDIPYMCLIQNRPFAVGLDTSVELSAQCMNLPVEISRAYFAVQSGRPLGDSLIARPLIYLLRLPPRPPV